jgi:hypothetical protein
LRPRLPVELGQAALDGQKHLRQRLPVEIGQALDWQRLGPSVEIEQRQALGPRLQSLGQADWPQAALDWLG